jgi:hypothetical protein
MLHLVDFETGEGEYAASGIAINMHHVKFIMFLGRG